MSSYSATLTAPTPRVVAPVVASERIQAVDVLRGFALFGILLVNMALFGGPVYRVVIATGGTPASLDEWAAWGIRFLAEGKFYSLFSLLFGFGLTIMMTRSQARGVSFVPLYIRRLLVLLAFGLIHAVFFWVGDVLVLYAVLGFPLLLFRNVKPRTLLIWMCIMLALVILINGALTGLLLLAQSMPESAGVVAQEFAAQRAAYRALTQEAIYAYGSGTFAELQMQRLKDLAFMYSIVIFILPSIFAMFLLGLYFGKREIFQNIPAHLTMFKRLLVVGLTVGVAGNLLFAFGSQYSSRIEPSLLTWLATVGQTIGAPLLALAYASAIILLMQRARWAKFFSPLAAMGRMALSNYFFQTIVCTTIFYAYGLGLYGQIGEAAGIVLTLVIYFAQIPLSAWWLKHYRFGPLEWLWRSLTYGKWQPMRLAQKQEAHA